MPIGNAIPIGNTIANTIGNAIGNTIAIKKVCLKNDDFRETKKK